MAFILDSIYDEQVIPTLGEATTKRLIHHIRNLIPENLFDKKWKEREFLLYTTGGIARYNQFERFGWLFKQLAKLPTSIFLKSLHFLDSKLAGGSAWKGALSNSKKTLTHDEAITGEYDVRVWRYQQFMEVGVFEGRISTRAVNDLVAECKALFGLEPEVLKNPA